MLFLKVWLFELPMNSQSLTWDRQQPKQSQVVESGRTGTESQTNGFLKRGSLDIKILKKNDGFLKGHFRSGGFCCTTIFETQIT